MIKIWFKKRWMETMMIVVMIVTFVVMGLFSRHIASDRQSALRERLKGCTYAGTRIERVNTVYQWDCNGIREETLRRLEDGNDARRD